MLNNAKLIQINITNYVLSVSKNIDEALEEIGQRGVGIVKGNTPKDTGRLQNSMSYSTGNKVISESPFNEADKIKPINKDKTVIVGTNVIYGPHVEYMSKNASKGFMLRSYKQWKPIAEFIIAKAAKRGKK